MNYSCNTTYMPSRGIEFDIDNQGYSEVVEALALGKDHLATITNPPGENIKGAEMGSSRFEFDGIADENEELEEGSTELVKEVYEDDRQENGEQGT
ncbi:hypothetical protein OIU76_027313 [Salix suchowensis]|nr:hypothetical protein OIU76_027313 [Salix suchowensis]